jgi:DNA-binding winged helix-turn-helix (wHTH) protein
MAPANTGRICNRDAKARKVRRRYRATLTETAAPTFRCGSASFDLDLLVAVVAGRPINIRSQEGRLLQVLFRAAGRVVSYEELVSTLYGSGVRAEIGRARLKSLVADLRRRFGTDVQNAVRTTPGKGLVLQLDSNSPFGCVARCTRVAVTCTSLEPALPSAPVPAPAQPHLARSSIRAATASSADRTLFAASATCPDNR